jgi:hypothetical protein
MASGQSLFTLYPLGSFGPSTNYATHDTRNTHPVKDFDAATDETAYWHVVLPSNWAGGSITVTILYAMSSATTGDVVWVVAIERIADEDLDTDSDSFDAGVSVTTTVPGTSGALQYASLTLAASDMDGAAAGEMVRISLMRDANDAADTATGDAELFAIKFVEA